MPKDKQSKRTKRYADKHLADAIKERRKGKPILKAKREREDRRREREKADLAKEEQQHKDFIAKLREDDPDMYEMAQGEKDLMGAEGEEENLLDLDDAGSDVEGDIGSGEDDDDEGGDDVAEEDGVSADEEEEEEAEEEADQTVITEAKVKRWLERGNLKMIFTSFRLACKVLSHPTGEPEDTGRYTLYAKDSAESIVYGVAQQAGALFDKRLGRDTDRKGCKHPHQYPLWRRIQSMVKTFFHHITTILRDSSNPDHQEFLLKATALLMPYLMTLEQKAKYFLKCCLQLLPSSRSTVGLYAFVNIQELSKTLDVYRGLCMKGLYLTMVRYGNKYDEHNLSTVAFLSNCVCDLWGTDLPSAYQHTFVYTRQLAVTLRSALRNPSEESFAPVYSWRYVTAFRVLCVMVSQHPSPQELYPLVYPLSQIGCGIVELFPSPRCFPMHLNIISLLNLLSSGTNTYIPVLPYLLRILESPEFGRKCVEQRNECPEIMFLLKVKAGDARDPRYQHKLLMETLHHLTHHLSLKAHSLAFPELCWPATTALKKLKKDKGMDKRRLTILQNDIMAIEGNAQWIAQRRGTVTFGPRDVERVQLWQQEAKADGPPLVDYFKRKQQERTRRLQAKTTPIKQMKTLEDKMADDAKKGDVDDVWGMMDET